MEYLKQVPTSTIWGVALKYFVDNVRLKTDEDFEELVIELQSQINDADNGMRLILGDSYDYFSSLNINYSDPELKKSGKSPGKDK